MIVIGIDAATRVGIAIGEPGAAPVAWTEKLGEGYQPRLGAALRLTARLIEEHRPGLIAIENSVNVGRFASRDTDNILKGILGCIVGCAYTRSVPVHLIEIATLDKHFVGARQKGRDARKRAYMQRARLLGWQPPDQDACDAMAVWDYACSLTSRAHSISTTPIFAGGATSCQS